MNKNKGIVNNYTLLNKTINGFMRVEKQKFGELYILHSENNRDVNNLITYIVS